MPEPSFLSTSDPERGDTKWVRWTKLLGQYQNRAGALPANNPARGDGIRVVKQKALCAIKGVGYTG